MYELSRVRLHSVGPKGARYQDVVLDLRNVGRPVARPTQDSLFEVTTAEPLRRPSPASVLFAENGNGKSVLIKLIFSVMLPGKRQVVGTTNSRVLENFVLATDVAFVGLEWQHTQTGERVVTGKLSAWRGHVVSSDSNRLSEAWYSFRPTSTFNLDSLPLTEDGRLVSLHGLHERFSEAERVEPQVRVVWETNHQAWTVHLEKLGLDSELFAYQRRMNAGEGEAADAFAFKSDEAFIDWLLTAITDAEEPDEVAGVLDGYATTLAQRGNLSAERDFVAGALGRLTPLASTARDAQAARELATEATRQAERFTATLRARQYREQAVLDTLEEEAAQVGELEESADREQRRLNAVLLELRRLVAGLRLRQAEQDREDLRGDRDEAKLLLAGWRSTDVLLRFRTAQQKAESLRRFVGAKEAEAEPILAERDRAGRRLVRGLLALADEADRRVRASEADVEALDGQIDAKSTEDTEHVTLAERERGNARAAQEKITAAETAIAELVTKGLLTAGADPAEAAARAGTAAENAEQAVEQAFNEQGQLTGQRSTAGAALTAATLEATQLARIAEKAHERHQEAVDTTAALAGEERLAALLGTTTVLLESDAGPLLTRLAEAVREADTELTRLRMADAADQKVLQALGSGGLLPPPEDVTAVQETLQSAGITSYAGWEYLAQMPDDERERALSAYPHLIDGVVLNNAGQLDRAEHVLAEARLLPRSVVAVGATHTFQDLERATPPTGLAFLVAPNPALYDEDLAEAERQILLTTQRERQARTGSLGDQVQADRHLHARLQQWQSTYPPGTLAELAITEDETRAAHGGAVERVTREQSALDTVEALITGLADRLPQLGREAQDARQRAGELTRVALGAGQIPQWAEIVRDAEAMASLAEATAVAARAEAARLRGVKTETVRRGDDQARIAAACRAEVAQVPGGGSATGGETPTEPVDTLRAAYTTAADSYEKVKVGADLRRDLAAADGAESTARADVEGLEPAVRAKADEVLATPDGADAPGRVAATARVERAVAEVERRISAADTVIGGLRNEYDKMQAQDRSLEPYGRPRDIPHGQELVVRVENDWNIARTQYDKIHQRSEELNKWITVTKTTVDAFSSVVVAMGDSAQDAVDAEAEAFEGTIEQARLQAKNVRDSRSEATALLEKTTTLLRQAASALSRYSIDQRFNHVDSPARRQILATDLDTLPDHAAAWETALRPRLRTLNDDLTQIDRHRSQIIIQLRGMVMTAIARLHSAERVSALPETLGDWAGQKFLKIRFPDPDPAALDVHLGQVVDDLAETGLRKDKTGRKRDGMNLLLKGVRAALPRGVKVELLKPDPSLRTERVRIAQVHDVFSGGQLLTSAIILYCTMAALRANEQGRTRRPHAGVLFLDNPIGRASAGYLLELQLGVADALGVQLIYTTGLFDVNALAAFPLIIRLRNDRDIRTGMKYLTVEDEIRTVLDALGEVDDTGRLTATRLFRRPQDTATPA